MKVRSGGDYMAIFEPGPDGPGTGFLQVWTENETDDPGDAWRAYLHDADDEGVIEKYEAEGYRCVKATLCAVEDVDALKTENAALKEALKWVAGQHCTMDAEGAASDFPCTETGSCLTEYCLSCYARAVMRTIDAATAETERGGGDDA